MHPRRPLHCSWPLLSCSCPLLGRSCSVLRRSWPFLGCFGASWIAPDRSWAAPGPHQHSRSTSSSGRASSLSIAPVMGLVLLDSLPRRPNHNLTALSFKVSKPPRFLFRYLFDANLILERYWAVLGWSWAILGQSWVVLGRSFGRSWDILGWSWVVLGRSGWSWGGLWEVLGRLGAVLGGSWGHLGRSKIDENMSPKLDLKTGRIATE